MSLIHYLFEFVGFFSSIIKEGFFLNPHFLHAHRNQCLNSGLAKRSLKKILGLQFAVGMCVLTGNHSKSGL